MAEMPVQESSDIVCNDPLDMFLGPKSGNKVLGNYLEDDIPDEVLGVLDEYGLHGSKHFRVTLKELPEGIDDPAMGMYIKSFAKTVPTIEYIGRNYGPGRYCMVFIWRQKDVEEGKMKNRSEMVLLEVSDKFEPEYREYQHKLKLDRLKKRKESVQDAILENKLEGTLLEDDDKQNNTNQSAKDYVREMLSFNEQLGLKRGGFDWDKVLPLVLTALPAALKVIAEMGATRQMMMQQQMTMMMGLSNNHNSQLIEIMKANGPQTGYDTMKEFREMLAGAIDMRELLAPAKPDTLADKIFSMVETVGPQLLQVAQMSAAARRNDPRVAMAQQFIQNNADFQNLEANPESKSNLIRKLDATYGWVQTDQIMQVMGWQRPADCPRLDEQQDPAGTEPSTKNTDSAASVSDDDDEIIE